MQTNMREQLISYKTAALAKEKGFDYEVRNYYGNLINPYIPYDKEDYTIPINFNGNLDCYNEIIRNQNEYKISAPTQSLLQKWLREVHDIHIVIRCTFEYFYEIYNNGTGNSSALVKETVWGIDDKLIYEEALEIALFESLKLIK